MSFDNERSIRRHGSNSEYKNPFGLPFAPENFRDAARHTEYLAGKHASGRRCWHPGCDRFISPASHVRQVHLMAMPETHDVERDELIGPRWIHADHPMSGEGFWAAPKYMVDALRARREAGTA